MFRKDDQSIELLCQLPDKPGVIPEPLNGSLIARVEEEGPTPVPE